MITTMSTTIERALTKCQALCQAFCNFSWILTAIDDSGTIIPILQVRKLRLKECKEFIHLDVRALLLDYAASLDILI